MKRHTVEGLYDEASIDNVKSEYAFERNCIGCEYGEH